MENTFYGTLLDCLVTGSYSHLQTTPFYEKYKKNILTLEMYGWVGASIIMSYVIYKKYHDRSNDNKFTMFKFKRYTFKEFFKFNGWFIATLYIIFASRIGVLFYEIKNIK